MPQTIDSKSDSQGVREAAAATGSRAGFAYALSAYAIWGFIPIYFHWLASVPPLTILYHRIIWSALFLAVVVTARKEWKLIWPVVLIRRNFLLLAVGAVLIATNWLLFIYAVGTKQLLQASLGYFINPLLSIALGMIFLRERLRGWQWLAVAIAITAVLNLSLRGTGFPWLALSLAVSFAFYGLTRKAVNLNSLHGLMIESAILVPLAAFMIGSGRSAAVSPQTFGALSLSGVITAVPLLCFGAALLRLPLSTMGFLQYVGPTLQFLVATCLFREPLDAAKLGSFGLCWLAIGIYVLDSVLNRTPQEIADEPE
jgi:chloramphenicol-sensitive protein RarD